jgi:heat shock protein HtpX
LKVAHESQFPITIPWGLGDDGNSALVKISRIAEEVPNDTAETHPATAPLFIINPLSGRGMDNLFSTHPSTENRVAALEKLSRETGLGGFAAAAPAGDTRLRGPWG